MINYIKLLSCWHKLEFFAPAVLPPTGNLFEIKNDLPWDTESPIVDPGKEVHYTVYLAAFPLRVAMNFLKNHFKSQTEIEVSDLEKAVYATLKVNGSGVYVPNSFEMSTLPWALGKLEKNNITDTDWSETFVRRRNKLLLELHDKLTQPLTPGILEDIQDRVVELSGWNSVREMAIYALRQEVGDETEPTVGLNSPFIVDLDRINENFREKQCSKAFLDYLRGCLNAEFIHKDLHKDLYLLKKELLPDNFPEGCWPSLHNLKLMQQFSVNKIINQLSAPEQEGLFSVNMESDDVKMTLLKEVMAAIIVKRAKAMANYEDPTSAFRKVGQIKVSDSYTPFVFQPERQIVQGGMVVVSPDDKSLDQISKKLSKKPDADSPFQDMSYFKEVSRKFVDDDNWGLISTILGNKRSINELLDTVWANQNYKFYALDDFLKKNDCTEQDWHDASLAFFKKLNEVRAEKRRMSALVVVYNEYVTVKKEKEQLDKAVVDMEIQLEKNLEIIAETDVRLEGMKQEKTELQATHNRIKNEKPGFWSYNFKSKVKAQYKTDVQDSYAAFKKMSDELVALEIEQRKNRSAKEKLEKEFDDLKGKAEVCTKKYLQLKGKVEAAKAALGSSYADNNFWENLDKEENKQSCPWYSLELRKLQSELFVLAMRVNETFILRANTGTNRLSTTLNGFFEYLKSDLPATKDEVKAMWDVFMLLIPVVCIPIDSVQRLFKGLEQKDLPWSFIDKAGTLTPQMAAGTLWRSQRAVIIGSRSETPTEHVPGVVVRHLPGKVGMKKDTIYTGKSVLNMADRANTCGTSLNDEWIGVTVE